jgi:hypothetical protein
MHGHDPSRRNPDLSVRNRAADWWRMVAVPLILYPVDDAGTAVSSSPLGES